MAATAAFRHVNATILTESYGNSGLAGWVPCGVGDWAVALRSPEGTRVAAEILALRKAWARAAE